MTQLPIQINRNKIDACCEKHHIAYLAIFAAILTSLHSLHQAI